MVSTEEQDPSAYRGLGTEQPTCDPVGHDHLRGLAELCHFPLPVADLDSVVPTTFCTVFVPTEGVPNMYFSLPGGTVFEVEVDKKNLMAVDPTTRLTGAQLNALWTCGQGVMLELNAGLGTPRIVTLFIGRDETDQALLLSATTEQTS